MSKVGNHGMDIETKRIKSAKDLRVYENDPVPFLVKDR
jgi:hypothetical protein